MIENVLAKRNCSTKVKITVKSLLSAGLVVLAVVLPQIIHIALGAAGGVRWLPMYLPVLLGGCLLGTVWGLGIGILSPLVSFALTAAFGSPMPAAARLPFMMCELAVIAAVSGAFSRKIVKSGWIAFAAAMLAFVAGRCAFMLLVLVFSSVTPFTPALIWAQIESGLVGLALQCVLVPLIVLAIGKITDKE